jgi:hypothetical protein
MLLSDLKTSLHDSLFLPEALNGYRIERFRLAGEIGFSKIA